jgi:glutamyl-tRNA(Gln) amidotransferase subunit D
MVIFIYIKCRYVKEILIVRELCNAPRELLQLGVIPTANMLPEVAYVKLAWALGQTEDLTKVKEFMLKSIAGETTKREPYNRYLIYQGGIPEVEEFLGQIKR